MIKLLAVAKAHDGAIEARVHPDDDSEDASPGGGKRRV